MAVEKKRKRQEEFMAQMERNNVSEVALATRTYELLAVCPSTTEGEQPSVWAQWVASQQRSATQRGIDTNDCVSGPTAQRSPQHRTPTPCLTESVL